MRDYEDLVKSLRYCAEYDCTTVCPRAGTGNGCISRLKKEAADAIEELSMKLHGDEAAIAGMKREIERMVVAGKPRWIPVTERLPDNEVSVLVVRKFLGIKGCAAKTYVEVAEYCYGDWVADSDEYKIARSKHTDPLYWMPLPEPPEGES